MLDRSRQALYCEGDNDKHVIAALLSRRLQPEPFLQGEPQTYIINPDRAGPGSNGGFEWALGAFASALELQKRQRIGLVVDRDTDKHRRLDAIRHRLAGIDTLWIGENEEPRRLVELGDVGVIRSTQDGRRWGIWLMPDNRAQGNLESFIETLTVTHAALHEHATSSTDAASLLEGAFKKQQRSKARLHAYLAWTELPGRPLGDAIRKGYLGVESSAANAFVRWFEQLFIEP